MSAFHPLESAFHSLRPRLNAAPPICLAQSVEAAIPYEIISFKGEHRNAETCSGNRIDARKLARESVKGGADRAEVRNAFGDLMFEYPEIAHRA